MKNSGTQSYFVGAPGYLTPVKLWETALQFIFKSIYVSLQQQIAEISLRVLHVVYDIHYYICAPLSERLHASLSC